jgi:hypothetical protein
MRRTLREALPGFAVYVSFLRGEADLLEEFGDLFVRAVRSDP